MMEMDVQMPAPFHRRELFPDLLKKVKEKKETKQRTDTALRVRPNQSQIPDRRRTGVDLGRSPSCYVGSASGARVSITESRFVSKRSPVSEVRSGQVYYSAKEDLKVY